MGEGPALSHVTAHHCGISAAVGGSRVPRPCLLWGSVVWPWSALVTHPAAAHSWGKSGWGTYGFRAQMREVGRAGLTSNSCSRFFLATAGRRHLLRVWALPSLILTGAFPCGLPRSGGDQLAGVSRVLQAAVQWGPSPLAGLPASCPSWQGPRRSPLEGSLPPALCVIICLVISPCLPSWGRPGPVEFVSRSHQEQRSCGQHHLAGQLHVQMPVVGLCSSSGGKHAGQGQRNAKNLINDCPIRTSSWILLPSGRESLASSGQLSSWSRGDFVLAEVALGQGMVKVTGSLDLSLKLGDRGSNLRLSSRSASCRGWREYQRGRKLREDLSPDTWKRVQLDSVCSVFVFSFANAWVGGLGSFCRGSWGRWSHRSWASRDGPGPNRGVNI